MKKETTISNGLDEGLKAQSELMGKMLDDISKVPFTPQNEIREAFQEIEKVSLDRKYDAALDTIMELQRDLISEIKKTRKLEAEIEELHGRLNELHNFYKEISGKHHLPELTALATQLAPAPKL